MSGYRDYTGRADRLSGGARRIPVRTPGGTFSVWTKRTGNNPDLKVLLLHGNPRYMELLMPHYYEHHTLRMPADSWPDPVVRGFAHINPKIYVPMQGPSELGMSADAKLATWDRFADLHQIEVPALVIGARYDTMDPDHMAEMARRLPRGSYLYCPEGSHLAMYDDQETYFEGLIRFLQDLPPAVHGPVS